MRPLRILLADDHQAVRQGIRAIVQSHPDWTICGEAADGLEAVQKSKELRPDAVLMDISMPHMDGLEATRVIRREFPQIKVIIVSQNNPAVARDQAAKVDAHGYVGKFDLSRDLPAAIDTIFDTPILGESHPSSNGSNSASAAWLKGGGEMANLIRAKNWAETPIGSFEKWSPTLRMMMNFLLANRFPALLWWGPQYTQFYNDAYVPIPGAKHPKALGQTASDCWPEVWHVLQPLVDTPFQGGPATWIEDLELEIHRSNTTEETHFTVAYSPVADETVPSGIGGVLATVHEVTEKIVGERRISILRDLGAQAAEAKSAEQACAAAAEILSKHPKDVPFALLYLTDADGLRARLVCWAGTEPGGAGTPFEIDLQGQATAVWPLPEVVRTEDLVLVDGLAAQFGQHVPPGAWSEPPDQAAIVPIRSNLAHQFAGFLIAGVSSRLKFDESYRSFLDLAGRQIATSIANARAYEQERQRAEALAKIDRAKTAFFSNVSHEFRTPLTLMLGPLEDLLARSQTDLSPAAKGQLEMVNRNGARLLRLVNTLLDFSRIEAGRVQAAFQPTELGGFTAELASVFRSATEQAGLRLIIDCPSAAQPVYVDRDMWEKIVLNLISNAFKFTFEGEIAVTIAQTGGEFAELRVRDTGIGIPPEEMPRLFERFHRIESARSRTHEGTGIGLALVHELVKIHGGTLRAESTLGLGTTFIVSLPLGNKHLPADRIMADLTMPSTALRASAFVEEALRWLPDASPAESEEVPPQSELLVFPSRAVDSAARPRVLVADDNADMRQYLVRLLTERYDVEAVSDGRAALESARVRRPELILSDVMMPRLDGLGLLRELRADPELNEIPILLLSAKAGEENRMEGVAAGADDYLVKPFSARELTARVEGHIKMHLLRQQARVKQQQLAVEYERLLNQAPIGIYLVDDALRIRQVNPVALPVFGNIPNLIGRDFDEVIRNLWTKEYADEIVQRFRNTLQTGDSYAASERAGHRIDRNVTEYYEWRVDRILLPEGKHGVVCYFRDVSAGIQARIAVAESEERYRKLAETLEQQVRVRTHELEQQSEQLRDLSAQLLQSQDEERRRIARELHDSAGQTLAALGMEHAYIAKRLKDKAPELCEKMEEVEKLVAALNQEIRTTSYLLHPPLLDEIGLAGALHWYVQGLTSRSNLEIRLEISEDFDRLASEMELAIFRIVQEALTNIHRHSRSKDGTISVVKNEAGISVEIQDHGNGISPEKLIEIQSGGSGVGLRGLRERVRQLHGNISIRSDSSGTRISAHFPISKTLSNHAGGGQAHPAD